MGEYFELKTLPKGWTWAKIGEIAETTSGGTPLRSRPEYYGGNIPWIKSGELRDNRIIDCEETITELGLKKSSAKIFPENTVVVALYGATVGRTGILGFETATNQAVCGLFPKENSFIPKYMFYWLQYNRQYLIDISMGGAQPNISQGIIRSLPFPLVSVQIQEQVVAKIEELFSQLDSGTHSLRQLLQNLKRYKASVLKAACEGRLVPQQSGDEPAEALLRRLGKQPLAGEGLPGLPEGWCWASIEQLAANEKYSLAIGPFGSNLKVVDYTDTGVPLVFVRNIRSGDFEKTHCVTQEKAEELRAHKVEGNDILITKMGEPPGEARLYPEYLPTAIITADCIKWRISEVFPDKMFFVHLINSPVVQKQIQGITLGVAQKKVSLDRFRKLLIPVPPLLEQKQILLEIEQRMTIADGLRASVERTLARAARLRQAVLKAAFAGRLG